MEVHADRPAPAVRNEHCTLARAEIAAPDAAGRDRADVDIRASPDRTAFRLEPVWKIDSAGKPIGASGGERQQESDTR